MHYVDLCNSFEPRIEDFKTEKFWTGDLSDEQFEKNRQEAYRRYEAGEKPSFSTGICESITAGYGRLDEYGYWEFSLYVENESMEILPLESRGNYGIQRR